MKNHSIPIKRVPEDPMELQERRPDEIKKAKKTPEERRKEIEARVAAARLLQHKSESPHIGNDVDSSNNKGLDSLDSGSGSKKGLGSGVDNPKQAPEATKEEIRNMLLEVMCSLDPEFDPEADNIRGEIEKQITPEFRESILRQTDVSLSLAKQLISSTKAQSKNLVFSPLSIQIVLGMIAAGSEGPTKEQLLGFLKSKSIEELNSLSSQLVNLLYTDGGPLGGPHLSFVNGVWVDSSYNLKPAFKEIVDNDYKAASDLVDFKTKAKEVRQEVNKWAKEQTNGLINEILPSGSVNHLTRLIFANALYFKGMWKDKFDVSKTKRDKFFLLNGTSIKVPFMTSSDRQYIEEFDGFKVLKLPYKQGKDYQHRFSMYFYLPDAKDGLPSLLEKIGSESRFVENHLPHKSVRVGDFRIPKFKIDFEFEAKNDLKQLGLVLPFSPGGLTEMVQNYSGDRLKVTNIFHKSFIEVNEKGTEVAAATAAVLGGYWALPSRRPEKVLDFVADHPFLFVIREDLTGAVFFIGQVLNP